MFIFEEKFGCFFKNNYLFVFGLVVLEIGWVVLFSGDDLFDMNFFCFVELVFKFLVELIR